MKYLKSFAKKIADTWSSVCYLMKYFRLVKGGKAYIFLQIVLTILDTLIPLVYLIIPGMIINELSMGRDIGKMGLYVAILVAAPLLNHLKEITLRTASNKKFRALRRAFQDELQSYIADMEYAYLEDPDIAVQLNEIGMNAPGAPLDMLRYLLRLIGAVIDALAVSSIIIYLNPAIVIVLLAIVLVNAWVTKKINTENYNYQLQHRKMDNAYWIAFHNLSDYANGKEIRLFRAKDFFINRYTRIGKAQDALTDRQEKYSARWRIVHAVTGAVQQGVLYGIALYKVIFDGLPIGSMTIFMSAAGKFSSSISNIFNVYLEILAYKPHIEEMKQFRSMPTTLENNGSESPSFQKHSVIEFRDVSFKYPGSDTYSLRHLNLKINCGEKLCIVGANGSGKTTFIKLITRLYVPTEGEILLDGVNIREYDYIAYQKLFSPVFQDFCLYDMPLSLNVAVEENFDADKVKRALEKAGIGRLPDQLSNGIDTYVGKGIDIKGFEPSGGEGQKIAIARALYHTAPIYLLDEPTAALDPFAEYEIYEQFNSMIAEHTAILITHRMSAVGLANKVAVFDKGHVAEYGTHAELYAKGGIYTEMFDRQAQFYRDDPNDAAGPEAALRKTAADTQV